MLEEKFCEAQSLVEKAFNPNVDDTHATEFSYSLMILLKSYPMFITKIKNIFITKLKKNKIVKNKKMLKYFFIGIHLYKTKIQIQNSLSFFCSEFSQMEEMLKEIFEVNIFKMNQNYFKEKNFVVICVSDIIFKSNGNQKTLKSGKRIGFNFQNLSTFEDVKNLMRLITKKLEIDSFELLFQENDSFEEYPDFNLLCEFLEKKINLMEINETNMINLLEILDLFHLTSRKNFIKLIYSIEEVILFSFSEVIEHYNFKSLDSFLVQFICH
jgi:hypothetical protein